MTFKIKINDHFHYQLRVTCDANLVIPAQIYELSRGQGKSLEADRRRQRQNPLFFCLFVFFQKKGRTNCVLFWKYDIVVYRSWWYGIMILKNIGAKEHVGGCVYFAVVPWLSDVGFIVMM